jgi:hypothetical protein
VEINHQQLDEILADFPALGRATYLDDSVLGLGYAATYLDELGIPQFSPDLPQVPVALIERHQALWTHPNNPDPLRHPRLETGGLDEFPGRCRPVADRRRMARDAAMGPRRRPARRRGGRDGDE